MQKEFQQNFGVPVSDIRADAELYRTESYNPKYREILVKEGLNPIAPANSEIISREVNPLNGAIQVVYGILAESSYMPLAQKVEVKPPPELVQEAKILRASDGLKQSEVVDLVTARAEYVEPTLPLDAAREDAKKNASVITEFPNLMGQKMEGFGSNFEWLDIIGALMVIVLIAGVALYAKDYYEKRVSKSSSSRDTANN